MNEVSRRDYFAATADITWINTSNTAYASAKTGVNPPPANPTDDQLSNFWIKVEIKWRWKYADLMLKGKD